MKKEKSRKIKIGVSFTVTFVLAVITFLIYKYAAANPFQMLWQYKLSSFLLKCSFGVSAVLLVIYLNNLTFKRNFKIISAVLLAACVIACLPSVLYFLNLWEGVRQILPKSAQIYYFSINLFTLWDIAPYIGGFTAVLLLG